MIERLLIQNFQRHRKLAIDFPAGITTIVGPSDAGKSAILRALRWVATNNPGGDAFVRHGAGGCTVRLVVDGRTITRRRSTDGETNTYNLDKAEYRAFGRGVPADIELLLNMGPVCWQRQHDAPFWFSESPGEVSRQLNAIVNLGVIDEKLAHTARELHRGRVRLEVAEEALTTAKAEHDGLAWVRVFENDLTVVEDAEDEAAVKRGRVVACAALVADATHYATTATRAADGAKTAARAVAAGTEARGHIARRRLLVELCREARSARRKTEREIPDFGAVQRARAAARRTADAVSSFHDVLHTARQQKRSLEECQERLRKHLAEMPPNCPTCERPM